MSAAISDVAARRIHLVSCIGVEHDLALLDHFLRHYRSLGVPVENMHLILNAPQAEHPGLVEARRILCAHDIEPVTLWIAPYTSDAMWQRRRDIQRVHVPADDWMISADVDEFHDYPAALPCFLADCERRGINAVDGVFVDRLARRGALPEVTGEAPLATQFPERRILQGSVFAFGTTHNVFGSLKMMAVKGAFLLARGGHTIIEDQPGVKYVYGRPLGAFPDSAAPRFRAGIPTRVHHYKWTGRLAASLVQRLASPGVSVAGRDYGQQIGAHLAAHDQRIAIDQAPRVGKRAVFGLWRTGWIKKREKWRRKLRKKLGKTAQRSARDHD